MSFRNRAPYVLWSVAVLGTVGLLAFGEIAGRTSRNKTFSGTATVGDGESRFSISIEPVSFGVNSVANKYKLLEISIENGSTTPLTLSSDQDRFEALVNGQAIPALLSLQRADSTLWNSFSTAARKDLAYPLRVGPATAGRSTVPEYLSIFVFLPADLMSEMPTEFRYTIASLRTTVTLRKPPATRA